jgi:two-component system, LytTR family, sensor histidine kinase AlgZ
MKQKTVIVTSFLPDFCGGRIVFVVIMVAELLAIVLTLAQPLNTPNRLFELAMYSMFIQWVALTCVATLCVSRRFLNSLGDYWAATWSYIITLLVTLLISELSWLFIDYLPASDDYFRHSHAHYLIRNMSISAIVSALALRYFYVQHQWRRRIESEAEARFQALQSRIRPHFLFNCMNTIASLTRRQPALAEESIEDLADLFRASLQDIHHASTLADEISLCKRYLRIEKHRLAERLQVSWEIDVLPLDMKLPSLSLQPILENAIYHGIEPIAEGGSIHISAEKKDKFYTLTVKNPLSEAKAASVQHAGNRLAQDNIRQRLEAFFGPAAMLEVSPEKDNYQVSITIPMTGRSKDV